ncbi:MAG: hypothetical protein CMM87_06550 [Rickettsiales bacterium]|nr:hypothetical protein [Rickettsiales bacterium]|tara:strand:+ start:7323 stop:9275 length:1953 start_codon:yes stop_codon:yes gene_type:complete
MLKVLSIIVFALLSIQCLAGNALESDLSKITQDHTDQQPSPQKQKTDMLFDFKSTPTVFTVMNNAHASIKKFIAQLASFLNLYVPDFDITFLFLFILYTICFFGVIRSIERHSEGGNKSQSFVVYTVMALLALLINTVFYGLSEQIILDKELELSMKSFVFLFSFVAIGKLAVSLLLGSSFNFFASHFKKSGEKKVCFVSMLNLAERAIIYILPFLVIALQAADYVQHCFHWADKCDDTIQMLILHIIRMLVCGYAVLFYLSIYATYSKAFHKWIESRPIMSIIISLLIVVALTEIVNDQDFFVNAFFINGIILLSPLINFPLFCLISKTISTPRSSDFHGYDKILQHTLRILLVAINMIIALRILVIINSFDPETIWFKELSDNIYKKFVTISFITAGATLIYYKVLLAAKKISLDEEKRFEKNLYLVHSNSKILTIINAVADLGTITFWPVYSYLILIELGLNEVYLSSFYGLVVVGALLGGKSSVDDFFKGLSYVLQGVIVRGGRVTINIGEKDMVFGMIEKIFLQNFYLRDAEGYLHTMNYSAIKSITFHNEVYSSFILNIPEDFDINSFNNILNEEKDKFNQSNEDQIEEIDVFNVSKANNNNIKISYLIKGQPIKVWKAQKLFEKRLGEILKKKKISYTLIPKP